MSGWSFKDLVDNSINEWDCFYNIDYSTYSIVIPRFDLSFCLVCLSCSYVCVVVCNTGINNYTDQLLFVFLYTFFPYDFLVNMTVVDACFLT